MSKYNPVKEVERIAQALVKQFKYSSMADFTAEDIDYIASEAQVSFADVVDILQAELV
jgi:hypothetical protein